VSIAGVFRVFETDSTELVGCLSRPGYPSTLEFAKIGE